MRKQAIEERLQVQRLEAGKMLIPLLGILALLSMAVAAGGIVMLMQEHEKRVAKEEQLREATIEIGDLKSQLGGLQQAKAKLEEDAAYVRKELADSQGKLAEAIAARETMARSVEDREREINRLTKDLEQVRVQQKDIATQLSELQTERDALKGQLAQLEGAKGQLEEKLADLSKEPTVQLDKITVAPQAGMADSLPSAEPTASSGQVVVVNREYDFIVMNIGKNHGLSVGQEFQIVRNDEVLGKVKVEKVYDELSAAAILPESRKDSIREGDLVKAL